MNDKILPVLQSKGLSGNERILTYHYEKFIAEIRIVLSRSNRKNDVEFTFELSLREQEKVEVFWSERIGNLLPPSPNSIYPISGDRWWRINDEMFEPTSAISEDVLSAIVDYGLPAIESASAAKLFEAIRETSSGLDSSNDLIEIGTLAYTGSRGNPESSVPLKSSEISALDKAELLALTKSELPFNRSSSLQFIFAKQDISPDVKFEIARSLLLEDRSANVRRAAAQVLGNSEFGEEIECALRHAMTGDSDFGVKWRARFAIDLSKRRP